MGAGSADTDGLCSRLFAIQIAHRVGVVPVTGSSACWHDGLDRIEVRFAQVHPQCTQRLCETVPFAGSDQRNNVLALRHDPGNRYLGDGRVFLLGQRPQLVYERQIVFEVFALEARVDVAEVVFT